MTTEELAKQLKKSSEVVIIDVRSLAEYRLGHIPGAIHIPFWKLGAIKQALADAGSMSVVMCCEHGPRAFLAGWLLGFSKGAGRSYLEGHMSEWKRKKLPLT